MTLGGVDKIMKDELKLVMEPYEALPCSLKVFTINGQDANVSDFVDTIDDDSANAPQWGCGNRCFHANLKLALKTMKTYNLTLEQFIEICEKLEDVLHVGSCGWCI